MLFQSEMWSVFFMLLWFDLLFIMSSAGHQTPEETPMDPLSKQKVCLEVFVSMCL